MICIKCRKKAEIHINNIDSCKKCFQEIIEKRVRKEARLGRLFSKGDSILILDDGSAAAFLNISLIKKIINGLPAKTAVKKISGEKSYLEEGEKGYNKIVLPWTADDECSSFLRDVMSLGKSLPQGHFESGKRTFVKPLISVLEEEAEEFCRIIGADVKSRKKKDMILKMLGNLEESHSEIKFGLLKSIRELQGTGHHAGKNSKNKKKG